MATTPTTSPAGVAGTRRAPMGTTASKPRTRSTGATSRPSFAWADMPGRAPAGARLDWAYQQYQADTGVDRAEAQRTRGLEASRRDHNYAAAESTRAFNRALTQGGLAAAGAGVGFNPALAGARASDAAGDFSSEQAGLTLEKTRRNQALFEAVRDARALRRDVQAALLLDAAKLADPTELMGA